MTTVTPRNLRKATSSGWHREFKTLHLPVREGYKVAGTLTGIDPPGELFRSIKKILRSVFMKMRLESGRRDCKAWNAS